MIVRGLSAIPSGIGPGTKTAQRIQLVMAPLALPVMAIGFLIGQVVSCFYLGYVWAFLLSYRAGGGRSS